MAEPPVLELDRVTVSRDGGKLLDTVSLTLTRGRHTAVLGPNGAGKTTLLRLLLREYYPSVDDTGRRGRVNILGRDDWNVADLRARMGVVSSSLDDDFSHGRSGRLTATEAVASGWTGARLADDATESSAERPALIAAALERCDASSLASRRLETLSTGERRRVLIARALVHRPEILVLDEPTSGLDPTARDEFLATLRRLARQPDVTLLLVTHHLGEIVPEIGRVVLLNRGRVVFDGTAGEGLAPERLATIFTRSSRGSEDADGPGRDRSPSASEGDLADGLPPSSVLADRLLAALGRLEPFLEMDPLTGLRNRLRMDGTVRSELESAGEGRPLAIAMVDIDRFGRMNATYGHRGGDQCLRHVAVILRGCLRETDLVFRYGGDEFLVLLPATSLVEAVGRLDRFREGLAASPPWHEGVRLAAVTVSIGVTCVDAPPTTPDATADTLLKAADAAMYLAKREGGDRVCTAFPP